MSNRRIRYEKTDDKNILKSVRTLISESTNAMYEIQLNTKECLYRITNINNRRVYRGGENINNLHILKQKAKDHLKKLGVVFESEIRDNTSRVVGKNCGYNAGELKE